MHEVYIELLNPECDESHTLLHTVYISIRVYVYI